MKSQFIKNSLAILGIFLFCFVLQFNLLILLIFVFLFMYLDLWKQRKASKCRFLHIFFLFVIFLGISQWIFEQGLSLYYIPFSFIPMLVIILWQELMVSLLMILACSFSLAVLAGDFNSAIIFLISGIISTVLLINLRRRSQIIRAGFVAGLFQALTWLIVQDSQVIVNNIEPYIGFFVNGAACGIAVVGFLPVFEYMFGIVTNISLLELSDFNQPILKKLMLEAPGTYHHSLIVGNLSEAACEGVGANALLARIGAYYHDIGKIEKAEYFSENQNIAASKHDTLVPSMSKLVIINHVKEGEALAKSYRLNPAIVDFIRQHHGTSLVYYFYRRALEKEDKDQISEEGFRYPGPKPRSKETAIVLLADSAEAATRGLKEPTPSRIEQEVHKIVNNKFIDGQLDECDLTLKDLEKICGIFSRLLTSIYHARITYPQEKRADNYTKPTEKNSRQKSKD